MTEAEGKTKGGGENCKENQMSMLKSRGAMFPCLLAGMVIVLVGPILADPVTFSDGTFNDADWAATEICGCAEGSFAAGQVATGGNPDAYRQTDLVFPGGSRTSGTAGASIVAHLNPDAVYDPAVEGTIITIDYSFDNIEFSNYNVGFSLLISQNETDYIAFFVFGLDGALPWWTHVSHAGVTASEFYDTSSNGTHPDFSSTGAPIQFGYYNSNVGFEVHESLSGIDNWSVTVNSGVEPPPGPEPSSSPEPSSALLLGSIVVGMMAFCRRRLSGRQ